MAGQIQDVPDPVTTEPSPRPSPRPSQALPEPSVVLTPATAGVAPGCAVQIASNVADTEPLNARTVRSICVFKDLHRDGELNRTLHESVNSLRDDIRALAARSDLLDTIIADIHTLRRDLNSLLERGRPRSLVEPQGADPDMPIVVDSHPAARQVDQLRGDTHANPRPIPTAAEEPNDSSFSKMTALIARLERLERLKRDERDHHDRIRHVSSERSSRKNRRERRDHSDTDSSPDRNHRRRPDNSSDDSSSEDDNRRKSRSTPKRGGTFRPKGDRYEDLKSLTASDSKFKAVLTYRYYRLKRLCKSRDLGQLRHQFKRMMVILRSHIFDGRDPILIFDFLRRYANERDAQGMSEAQAHCALESFLDSTAADHYSAVNNSSTADEGGVTWPEAVHYLLRSYTTHDAIREATLKLTSIRQGSTETEEEYSARPNNAAIRCGNFHSMDENKTIYIDGLLPAIKALVSRYREENPRATYLELLQFSSVEGKTHRARTGVSTPRKPENAKVSTPKQSANPLLKRSKPALYAERSDADNIFSPRSRSDNVDNVHLLGDTTARFADLISDDKSDLPTTVHTDMESDPALFFTPRSHATSSDGRSVRPQRLNYDNSVSRNRPGWEVPRDHPRRPSPGRIARIICHVCYVKDKHIAPGCDLSLKEQWQVVRSYSDLTAEEKSGVAATSYYRARAQFADDGKLVPNTNANRTGGPPPDHRRSDERHPAVLQRAKSPTLSAN